MNSQDDSSSHSGSMQITVGYSRQYLLHTRLVIIFLQQYESQTIRIGLDCYFHNLNYSKHA